jgi:hypothetical protein
VFFEDVIKVLGDGVGVFDFGRVSRTAIEGPAQEEFKSLAFATALRGELSEVVDLSVSVGVIMEKAVGGISSCVQYIC